MRFGRRSVRHAESAYSKAIRLGSHPRPRLCLKSKACPREQEPNLNHHPQFFPGPLTDPTHFQSRMVCLKCNSFFPGLTMDMSSYQFVNTLAQCYEANAQLQGAGAAAAGSVGAGTAPQDYYNMQYPNCYSPATQGYAQQYSSMMGAAASHDYTPPSSSATLSSSQASARRSPGLPSAPSAPSLTPAPLTQSNLAANCKYTDSNVGSPQDLSTTSSGGTPQPGAGPKSPDSDIEDNGPTSPLSPSPGAGASSSATATSTKKESDTKSSPPQIYPWMKRVHLGQSKCHFLFDPSPDLD